MTQTKTKRQQRREGAEALRAVAQAFRTAESGDGHYDDPKFYGAITDAGAHFNGQPDASDLWRALTTIWKSSRCAEASLVALALDLLADKVERVPAYVERANVSHSAIYARDLRDSLRNDGFMGAGFEDLLAEAEENGDDVVVGYFVEKAHR